MNNCTTRRFASSYFILAVAFLLAVNVTLGYLLMSLSSSALISLLQTRMLDISNTAAAMLDGDAVRVVTPEDKGTPDYDYIMDTLGYFRDNTGLSYIYCVLDGGDGKFTFGLDADLETPGEFGSPVVYTDALDTASKGTPAVDNTPYQDEWGSHYSAYSPIFDSKGKVAGIVAVDFDASWYEQQLATLTTTTVVVAAISLFAGGGIVAVIVARSRRRIDAVQEQLDDFEGKLMSQLGTTTGNLASRPDMSEETQAEADGSIEGLGKRIEAMQGELHRQITMVQERVYLDSLTGVRNRTSYLDAIHNIELAAKEAGYTVCINVFDINGLKTINDTFGHDAGDAAIRDTARVLVSVFGEDCVYRIGGDEFVSIVKTLAETGIETLFAQVDKAVASVNGAERSYGIPLSISKGSAVFSPGDSYIDTFRLADEMMFEDKIAYYRATGYQRASGAIPQE